MKKMISLNQIFFDKLTKIEKNKYCHFEFAIKIQNLYFEFVNDYLSFEQKIVFKSKRDEEHYFTEIKPSFIAHFIYARKILEIEAALASASDFDKIIAFEQSKILHFKEKNFELSKAYKNKTGQFAEMENYSIGIYDDQVFKELSRTLTFDLFIAFYKAYEKIEIYLLELKFNKTKQITQPIIPLEVPFTKTEIAELSYAIQELKGKRAISVKHLASKLGAVFGVEAFNIYDAFRDIGNRDQNKTILLNKLQSALLVKIDNKYK